MFLPHECTAVVNYMYMYARMNTEIYSTFVLTDGNSKKKNDSRISCKYKRKFLN